MDTIIKTSNIPLQAHGYDAEIIDDETMLYSIEKTEAVYLNQAASIVWALCDGNNTAGDILDTIITHFSEDTDTDFNQEVFNALDALLARNVISIQ